MSSVIPLVASQSSVAFSGSRAPSSLVAAACSEFCSSLLGVGFSGAVSVGCAAGIDALVRAAFPSASVFSAAAFPASSFAGALARRSAACVASAACLVAFPASVVPPAGVCWSGARFCGAGSGTWGSVGLAVGLGLPVLVFLPAVPSACPFPVGSFACVSSSSAGSWWWSQGTLQLSLF